MATKRIKIGKNQYKARTAKVENGCTDCVFNKGWKYCREAEELSGLDCVLGYIWEKVK